MNSAPPPVPNPGVFVGVPAYDGKMHWTTIAGLNNIAYFCGKKGIPFCVDVVPGDAFIDKGRNTLVHRFLKTGFTDLLFVDADVGFNLHAVSEVMKSAPDIVMGLYRVKDDRVKYPALLHEPITPHPDDPRLVKMQYGPAGFMRIRRNVFERMREKWPDAWYVFDHGGVSEKMHDFFECGRVDHRFDGEDIAFCKRAIACGFDIWAVQGIELLHTGAKTFPATWQVLKPVEAVEVVEVVEGLEEAA